MAPRSLDRTIDVEVLTRTPGAKPWSSPNTQTVTHTVWAARHDGGDEPKHLGTRSMKTYTVRWMSGFALAALEDLVVVDAGERYRVVARREEGRRRYLLLDCEGW